MAATAGSAKACNGATINRTTKDTQDKPRASALKAIHGGTTRASADIVFGASPSTWRADPEAVEILAPLLELAKRVRHVTLDVSNWDIGWARPGSPGTPTGKIKISMTRLGLTGEASIWTQGPTEWLVDEEGRGHGGLAVR